jgi:hypothetical protein
MYWKDEKEILTFPSFSFQFPFLETFSMIMPYDDMKMANVTGKEIMKLPKTLTNLRLEVRGAHFFWFSHYKPLVLKDCIVTNITGTESDFEQLYDLKEAFPMISEVKLVGEELAFGARLLNFFAPSLTSATLCVVGWQSNAVKWECKLPPNLRSLNLGNNETFDWQNLEPLTQLEVLKLSHIQSSPEHLPKTLTILDLGVSQSQWSESQLIALSQLNYLTTLSCSPKDVLSHLPNSLTKMELTLDAPVDVEIVKKLPRRLRSLSRFSLYGDLSNFDIWPPSLTYLAFCLSDQDAFPPKDPRWLSLPKSLTSLRATNLDLDPLDIHPNMLPPLIRSLNFRRYNLENEIIDFSILSRLSSLEIDLFHDLSHSTPANQTSLQNHISLSPSQTSTRTEKDDSLNSHLSSLSLDPSSLIPCSFHIILPSRLTRFLWICHHYQNPTSTPDTWYFRDSFASWLPDSLTSFYCDDARLLTNQFCARLPKGLRTLLLELKNKSIPVQLTSDAYKALPPRLTELKSVIHPNADDSFVPFLPRSLIHLTLERLTTFNDSSVPLLPSSLETLHLRHVTHGLTDECIPSLPKRLENILLEHNKSFTPEAFFAHNLPKLSSLDVRANPNFTKKKILQLAPVTLYIKAKRYVRG